MGLHDLKTLIRSHYPLIIVESVEEERALQLLQDAADELLLPVFEWSLSRGLCRSGDDTPIAPRTEDPVEALRHIEALTIDAIFIFKDMGPHMDNLTVLRFVRDACAKFRHSESCMVIMGSHLELSPELRHDAVWFEVKLPNEEELGQILDSTLRWIRSRNTFSATVHSQKGDLIQAMRGMTRNQARQSIIRAVVEDERLDAKDLADIQRTKAAAIRDGGLLEFYACDDLKVELGGFNRLRQHIQAARHGFGDGARALNLDPPKGVMLLGVQGCGKSLAAKAIAQEFGYPLLKLDAGRLYDKYIGESEKNFHRATQMAETMSPCVLWIDEMEKAFATGSGTADGATSQRILGSFLTWMQENRSGVFLVATANEVDSLPPELMRKGRFDEIFFVDLPGESERLQIWKIHLKHRHQDVSNLDLGSLVEATEGFSGAEIEQVIVASLFRCLQTDSKLCIQTLLQEIYNTIPLSISRAREVSKLRRESIGRFVLATTPEETLKVA